MAQILIVDDSPTEIHVVRSVLEKMGHSIETATDGESGYAKAKELKPDLILMDVVMPGMNGFQATRKIAKDPEIGSIPVIMVTSKDQETDRVWGLRQGATDYIVKPVDESELVQKVKAALGG